MFKPVNETRRVQRDDVLVLYNHDTADVLALCAKVLQARDPYLLLPPAHSSFVTASHGVGDSIKIDGLNSATKATLEVQRIMMDPSFWPSGAVWQELILRSHAGGQNAVSLDAGRSKYAPPPQVMTAITAWASIFQDLTSLTAAGVSMRRPEPLSSPLHANHPLHAALAGIVSKEFTESSLEDTSGTASIVDAHLILSYGRLIASNYLSVVKDSDAGSGVKTSLTLAERAARFTVLISAAHHCVSAYRLRPYLRLLLTQDAQNQLRYAYPPSELEWFKTQANVILNMPMLPWLAVAEGGRLPRAAETVWGANTECLGLPSAAGGVIGASFHANWASYATSVDSDAPLFTDYNALYVKVLPRLRAMLTERETLAIDGRLDSALNVLGCVTPTVTPFPLWAPSVEALHSDGVLITESVPLESLHLHPLFPVDSFANARPWIGDPEVAIISPVTNHTRPLIYIEPERPEYSPEYVNKRISPAQVASFPVDYLGEADATFVPHDPKVFAESFSIPIAEIRQSVMAGTEWASIFSADSDGNLFPSKPTPYYVSTRTKRVWYNPVVLPEPIETVSIGINRGVVVGAERPVRTVLRDDQMPVANQSLGAIIDAFYARVKAAW